MIIELELKKQTYYETTDFLSPKYKELYEKKQREYGEYFKKQTIYPSDGDQIWNIKQEKNLLEKFCYYNVGIKSNEYPRYEQKTFGIKNYTLIGELKLDEESNLIKNPSELVLQDQDGKKYKVYYTWKKALDFEERFQEEYAESKNIPYVDLWSSFQNPDPYIIFRLERDVNYGFCLDLEPMN